MRTQVGGQVLCDKTAAKVCVQRGIPSLHRVRVPRELLQCNGRDRLRRRRLSKSENRQHESRQLVHLKQVRLVCVCNSPGRRGPTLGLQVEHLAFRRRRTRQEKVVKELVGTSAGRLGWARLETRETADSREGEREPTRMPSSQRWMSSSSTSAKNAWTVSCAKGKIPVAVC